MHEDDKKILLGILQLPMPEDHGLHSLVYAPKSVDKRDMLARLLQEEGIDGYTVITKHVPDGDLPTWIYIAQRYLGAVKSGRGVARRTEPTKRSPRGA